MQALSRLAAQAANPFQPSPIARGDSDAPVITPLVTTPRFISSFRCPVVPSGVLPGVCCSCRCPRARGAAGAALAVRCPSASPGEGAAVVSPWHSAASRAPSPLPGWLCASPEQLCLERRSQPAERGIIKVIL